MATICIICKESLCCSGNSIVTIPSEELALTGTGVGNSNEHQDFPVAALCGHLYHNSCIRKWFTYAARQHSNFIDRCPYCQKSINISTGLIRLYPSVEVEKVKSVSLPIPNYTKSDTLVQDLWSYIYRLSEENEELREFNKDLAKFHVLAKNENVVLKIKFDKVKTELAEVTGKLAIMTTKLKVFKSESFSPEFVRLKEKLLSIKANLARPPRVELATITAKVKDISSKKSRSPRVELATIPAKVKDISSKKSSAVTTTNLQPPAVTTTNLQPPAQQSNENISDRHCRILYLLLGLVICVYGIHYLLCSTCH